MRADAEAQEREFGRLCPAARIIPHLNGVCSAEKSVGIERAELQEVRVSPEARVLGVSAVRTIVLNAESSPGQEREFPETGIPPEQQRE